MNLPGRKVTVVLLVLTLHAVVLFGLRRTQPVAPPTAVIPLMVKMVTVPTPTVAPKVAPQSEKPHLKPQVQRQAPLQPQPQPQPQLQPQPQPQPQSPQQPQHESVAAPAPTAQLPLAQAAKPAQTDALGATARDMAQAHRAPMAPAPTEAGTQSAAAPLALSSDLSLACPTHSAPSYPALSRRLNEQGIVVLHVLLSEDGAVTESQVQVSSGFTRLDNAALMAVRGWRCNALKRNGVSVPAAALQPFRFELQEK